MKTGEEESKKNENSSSTDVKALTEMVLKLQKELNEVKIANTQVSSSVPMDMVKMLAEFNAASEKAKNLDYRGGIRAEDIPMDDHMDEVITFCAPFTGYAIADDKRKGHLILLPYNMDCIFFEFQGTRRQQEGKHIQLLSFSTYKTQSKKVAQWLREHTFFNTMFYESTKGAASFDVQRAMKLSRIMSFVSNFEMPQIINRCKDYQIPIGEDLDVMRSMLAMKMADAELNSEQTSTQRRLVELEKEKELLQQNRS